jgi:mannose-6-phosphate isomerase
MQEILRFQPLYQERVWGGRAFESAFDRKLTSENPIGESWEIVDRPEAQSVVKGGTHSGEARAQRTGCEGEFEQQGSPTNQPSIVSY